MKQNAPRSSARKAAPQAPARQFPWLTPRQLKALKVIFIISFVVSLVLELYVFGFPDGFFLHWLNALMVLFLFIGLTVLGIIPLVNYIANRWLRF